MGLLPSNPMVHLSVIVRALTSLISISGGSGGSVPSTERPKTGVGSNQAWASTPVRELPTAPRHCLVESICYPIFFFFFSDLIKGIAPLPQEILFADSVAPGQTCRVLSITALTHSTFIPDTGLPFHPPHLVQRVVHWPSSSELGLSLPLTCSLNSRASL